MNKEPLQRLSLDRLKFIGKGLSRPECALAHSSGTVFAPDWTDDGGVSVIFSDGTTKRHLAKNWAAVVAEHGFSEQLRGNGICLLDGGDFLIAHLGAERGGVFRLSSEGIVTAELLEIDGVPLPPTNFVTIDDQDRLWVTVSTRQVPRAKAYRRDVADGFIAVSMDGETRIVADNLGYANECLPHPDGKRLFVNETFARRLTSFDVEDDGSLTDRKTVAEFGPGIFPDGLVFDEHGDAWVTSIISNRVLRIRDSGEIEVYLEDADAAHLDWVDEAWRNNEMGRPHLDKAAGSILRNVSNMAFCGTELNEAVLGCLLDDKLVTLPMPVRGQKPLHWTCNIDPLIKALESIPSVTG